MVILIGTIFLCSITSASASTVSNEQTQTNNADLIKENMNNQLDEVSGESSGSNIENNKITTVNTQKTDIQPTSNEKSVNTISNNEEYESSQTSSSSSNLNTSPQAAASETFTNAQIATAATSVQKYVETNKKLPNNVTINGITVSMPSFLELLTTAVININGGKNTAIDYITFGNAPNPKDAMNSGSMSKAEYLKIASNVKSFMDKNRVAPEYAYATSLGWYFGYQNMVYTYSKIMSYYSTNKALPSSVSVNPWKYVIATKFNVAQIASAATWVKNYVDTNNALPSSVTINNINVSMPSFLELLTTATLNIKNGNSAASIPYYSYGSAPAPKDTVKSGNMGITELLSIASNVKSFMDKNGVAPEYAYGTSLGWYFGYQNLVYTYSCVLNSYSVTSTLPSSVAVNPWIRFNINDVVKAASSVKIYIDNNHKLQNYITISGNQVSMPSFLELITTAILKINNNDINSKLYLYTCGNAANPRDEMKAGLMPKSEYIKIAQNVKNYMDSKGVAPEYAYNTSLGWYFGYQNMIYTFSTILDTYNTNNNLVDPVNIKPWNNPIKINIIIGGTGGYVNNNAVVGSYIPSTSLTNQILSAAVSGTPMITIGNGSGPKVMIVAGVHGNELPAQIAAMHLINYLKDAPIKGTIYIIPFVVPANTATSTRFWNGQNLNSVANVAGTPTNQILNLAKQLNVNALGDFHSSQPGGVPGTNAVFCSISPTYTSYLIASYISGQTNSKLISYAKSGVEYPGALEDTCQLAGIPAVTCEVLSPHGSLATGSVETSYNQMLAFLRYENII